MIGLSWGFCPVRPRRALDLGFEFQTLAEGPEISDQVRDLLITPVDPLFEGTNIMRSSSTGTEMPASEMGGGSFSSIATIV